jgi:hypothetical protein
MMACPTNYQYAVIPVGAACNTHGEIFLHFAPCTLNIRWGRNGFWQPKLLEVIRVNVLAIISWQFVSVSASHFLESKLVRPPAQRYHTQMENEINIQLDPLYLAGQESARTGSVANSNIF